MRIQNTFPSTLAMLPPLLLLNVLAMDPPASLGRNKVETNDMTMDQAILQTLGGVGVAANLIMDEGSDILAELDMYMPQELFNNMYAPPDPEDMVDMGIMPAPMGAPKNDTRRGYDLPKDFRPRPRTKSPRSKRKAAAHANLWTDATVPYVFARDHFTKDEEYMMRRSMTEWERYTCLRFRPSTKTDKDVLRFQNGMGCNSQLGMIGGVQALNLQTPGCRFKGLYLHEIGHAVGLVHEHQLPDRDQYIRILFNNVSPHMKIWFNKYKNEELTRMNVPYELSSVMHYGITAFSKDGESQTIQAVDRSKEETIGKVYLKELAYTDVEIVNKFYNCAAHCPDETKCGSDGHLDENCNCICRDGSQDCDRTKQRSNPSCKNAYYDWPCNIWAKQGECKRNKYYMDLQCAKACGTCGTSGDEGQCKDTYSKIKCEVWKARGDCVTNREWMKKHCGTTCKLCSGQTPRPEENCANTHSEEEKCERWAQDGECIVNRAWMFKNCRKSCHMCQETDGGDDNSDGGFDEDDLTCENKHDNCENWARIGECTKNPPWMVANCRKACDKCDDGRCKNLYVDVRCDTWAEKLECMANSEWMGKFCARSCVRGPCEGDPNLTTPSTRGTTTPTTRGPTDRPTDRPTTPAVSCTNVHPSSTQCEGWAKAGHCEINPSWMLPNCALSCAKYGSSGGNSACVDVVIEATTTTTTVATGDKTNVCHDEEELCPQWAKGGHCDGDSAVYMLKSCKKSCNNCNGCRDAEFLCSVWAKADHCFQNPRYMMRHCQKSCHACTISQDLEQKRPDGKKGGGSEKEGEDGGMGGSGGELRASLWKVVVAAVAFVVLMG